MSRIYAIKEKNVPSIVRKVLYKMFPNNIIDTIFTFKFYSYIASEEEKKCYGCFVSKNGDFWHNATQGTKKDFREMLESLY